MSVNTSGSGAGGDGRGEKGDGDGWTTVTKKAKLNRNRNKGSDAESEESSSKTFRIVKDGQQEIVKCFRNGKRAFYGKDGNKYCCICSTNRDHYGATCPGFFCHKCHEYGHWAKGCTTKLKCSFCGDAEHSVDECPRGGRSFSMATKRPSTETASSGPAKRVSATAVAPPAAVGSGISYSSALSRKPIQTTGESIGSFLDLFKGYDTQDFDGQLARLDSQEQEVRQRFEEKMAALEAKRREVLRNKRNANKLSSLLAQLKEVQADMVDGSDEESTLQVDSTGTVVEVKGERVIVNVGSSEGRSSSTAPSSTAVGVTTGFVAIDAVSVDGIGSLGESSTVPGRATVGDATGPEAMDTGGVSRTRSLDNGDRRLGAAIGGDFGSTNVISRTRSNSDSELELISKNPLNWYDDE